ncbi:hypothetical protein L195_g063020, partial [Trifolium pratense]
VMIASTLYAHIHVISQPMQDFFNNRCPSQPNPSSASVGG